MDKQTEIEKQLAELSVPEADRDAKQKAKDDAWLHMRSKMPMRLGRRSHISRAASLLIIVGFCFSLLSYMVTQSTRSSGGDAGKETNRINSAQLTQYPASVRTSIVRMIIQHGEGLFFAGKLEFNSTAEFANCTEDPPQSGLYQRCVFHPAGGGATYVNAPAALMADGKPGQWVFNGANEIDGIGKSNVGDSVTKDSVDLIAFLSGINKGVCQSINNQLGLPVSPLPYEQGVVYDMESSMVSHGSGTSLTANGTTIGVDATGAKNVLSGQPFGCFFDHDNKKHVYYHVLIER